ncbi:leader peptidase (Prepilin peptidase) / N-methyltransferase [Sulfurospirillum diekertiae]|uniref:Leader peptidase (Prepilin peptidase) / N-methyltransferase n=1 Tax=Sulfurospirillum diekertiae TaxID=1854492 RepID=A0A290HDH1_9BACT|nr:A24 family peptidase [Sulfurospirillum diekertiae]ATB69497.1 leader peptidase (Prepilin peptidase) / N-methyltransferase [Sulfurospirillum diekertiae]
MEVILITLFGLCIGSFLNVAILRLPKGESISLPASHCPHCLHPLKWYHNIPLASWFALRGKCAFCKSSISMQYPLVELGSALMYALCYVHLGNLTQTLLVGSVFALLLALSIIDLRYKAVPDSLSLPALLIAFCTAIPLQSFQNGLLLMGAFTLLRFLVSALTKKEAMGEADSIIAGIIGALLGIKLGLVAIYLAAVIALVAFVIVRKRGYELPFIPFLSLGLLITWFFDLPILHVMEFIYE